MVEENKKNALKEYFFDINNNFNSGDDFKNFFYNSKLTYEDICSTLESRFKSRTTIKSILNEGVKKGFFLKTKSSVDPRNKNYTPSCAVELFMQDWIKDRRKIFKK